MLLGLWLIPAKLKLPLHPFNTNCMVCQVALLEECFKVLWSPSISPPPSLRTYFRNYFQERMGRQRRAGAQEALLGKKTSEREFQQRWNPSACQPITPFSLKSLNPLSCHHCTLFQCLYCMQERHFFFLGRRKKKIINLH